MSTNEFTVLLISPLEYWGIAAISTTPPCPWLLEASLQSRLEWGTTHNWAINREMFFWYTRTYGRLPFLALPGTWATAAWDSKFFVLSHILHVPYLNHIGNADSFFGRTFTDSWWGNGFTTKPPLPCTLHCLSLRQDFLVARLEVNNDGASSNTNSPPRVKMTAVSDGISGSDSIVQHPDPSFRKETSLGKRGVTNKVLHAGYCPLHPLVINRNSIKRHSKRGMYLWWIPDNECCQLKDLKQQIG